jgi:hypothetical protein
MDQLYFESGYLEAGYFESIKQTDAALTATFSFTATVDIANTNNYFIPDYIEEGYFQTPVKEGEASLTVTCTHSTDAQRNRFAQITITDAFNVTFTVNASKNMLSDIISQFDWNITASKIASNQSTLNNIVTLSLQGDRQAVLAATTLSSEFTQSTQIQKILNVSSTFNPAFSINADGNIVAAAVEAAATLNTAFTTQCVNDTIRGGSVTAQLEFTHSTQADRIKSITADILISFQSANVITGFLQDAQVNITDAFTPTITASALKNHTAVLDVVCSLSCVISKTTNFGASLHTEIVQSTQVSVIISPDITITSAFTQLSTVNKTVAVSSDHTIQFNTSITVGKVVRFTDTVTITVTNVGLVFYIDGVAQPTLTLLEGNTYIFNHPSNHPIAFSTTPNGTHGGGTEYTTGITRDVYNYKLTFVVGYDTPTLYYYCQVHSGMGGTALTPRPTVDITSTFNINAIIFQSKWFNHPYRPLNLLEPAGAPGRRIFSNSIKKFGSHALGGDNSKIRLNSGQGNDIDGNFTVNDQPAIFGINDDIYKDLWMRVDGGDNFTRRIWDFIYGPAVGIYNRKLYITYSQFINNGWTGTGFGSSTQPDIVMSTQLSTGVFHHVAYIFTASQRRHSLYVDGTRVVTQHLSPAIINWSDTSQTNYLSPTYFDNNATFNQYYDDMKWFRNYTFGYTANDTTIAVPSTEYTPQDDVYTNLGALYRFNDNYLDSLDVLSSATANFSIATTVTVTAGKSVSSSATVNTQFAVSVIIGEIEQAEININTESSLSTVATRIKSFTVSMNALITQSVTVIKTTDTTITFNSAVSISCTVTRIFVLQSNFESIATQLTSVARVGAGLILAEVFVNQSVTAVKTAVAQADATVISTLVLAADRFRLTTANTQIEFTLNTVNSRIRALNSAQQTDSALTVTTVRIRSTDSTQNSAFTIFCEPLPILNAISNQSAQFTQSIITDRTRSTSVTFNTAFTQQSNGIIAVDAVAALSTQSQITCVVDRFRPGVIIMDAIAVKVTAAAKTGTALVTVELQSQCTVTAQKTTDIQLNAVSTAELTSIIERTQQGVSNITSQFTQIANGITSTDVTANLNTIFSTTTTAQKTARVIANITSAGGFVMAVAAIRNGEIIMVTQTNITTLADRRRNTDAVLSNSFTVNILAGVLAVANSVQNTQFAIIATVSKLRLDDIVLYIKTESRTHHINNEQRSYALRQENRLYTIEE